MVVSHRVVCKLLVCAALGLGLDSFWRVRVDTCSLGILQWQQNQQTAVALLNDTCHLHGISPDAVDF